MIQINSKKFKTSVVPTYAKNKQICFFEENFPNKKEIIEELKNFNFESKQEETILLKIKNQKILFIGINKNFSLEDIRRAYSIAYKTLTSKKEFKFNINVPKEDKETITSIIEGINLSNYSFDKYLTKKEKNNIQISLNISPKFKDIIKKTLLITENVKLARDMINENADEMTPIKIEKIIKSFAKKHKLKTKILDEKKIKKERLGLLEAVGRGANNPPRLILVEYKGNKNSKENIALVGKGITFDTGGLNLKPTNYIEDMKTDMGGCAVMYATFKSAVELKLKKNLVLVLCCAENAISNKAYKPGDIFKSYSGISVEITNTDAEGRLVLADGISYVQKNFKINQIIDAATLTGAIMVALGKKIIGMFGNNEKMKSELFEIGEKTNERVWNMPIYEEHRDVLKSDFADTLNCDKSRYGGSCSAAAFLEKFIEKNVKWIHLDIAGVSRGYENKYYVPKMGTGVGVRLLVNYLEK